MTIYDGNKSDTTNRCTDKYLEINSCGFQNSTSDYTVIRKNGRKDYHILLISNGECQILHNKKQYLLTSGNFVIYFPDEEQKYSFKCESTSLWCHFGGTAIDEILKAHGIESGVYLYEPNKNVSEAFANIIRYFHLPSKTKFANVFLLELLCHISDGTETAVQNKNQDIVLPILTYINAMYNRRITLEELARKAGYSKSRFSRIFTEVTKTTPIKYQNDIRLQTAREMLVTTNLSVKEIASSCGFEDALYFSRSFRKKYGISPTKVRTTDTK